MCVLRRLKTCLGGKSGSYSECVVVPSVILTSYFLSVKTCWENSDTFNVEMLWAKLSSFIIFWKVYTEINSVNAETRKAFRGKVDFIIRDHHKSSVSLLFIEIWFKKKFMMTMGKLLPRKKTSVRVRVHTGEKLQEDDIYIYGRISVTHSASFCQEIIEKWKLHEHTKCRAPAVKYQRTYEEMKSCESGKCRCF